MTKGIIDRATGLGGWPTATGLVKIAVYGSMGGVRVSAIVARLRVAVERYIRLPIGLDWRLFLQWLKRARSDGVAIGGLRGGKPRDRLWTRTPSIRGSCQPSIRDVW